MANGKQNVTNNFGEQSTQYLKPIGEDGPIQMIGNVSVYSGTGAPNFEAPGAAIYYREDGANGSQVIYTNYDGDASHWAALITA